jgi:hypothetical protein
MTHPKGVLYINPTLPLHACFLEPALAGGLPHVDLPAIPVKGVGMASVNRLGILKKTVRFKNNKHAYVHRRSMYFVAGTGIEPATFGL